MSGRSARRQRNADAHEIARKLVGARFISPEDMPLRDMFALINEGGVVGAVRLALGELQLFERETTIVTAVRVVPGETTADGAMTAYHIRVDYEHDCPNGACDDCIGND